MVISILFKIIIGLCVLGILIFVHELGHFLLAKWCRVGVLEFAIGFGKKIWQKRIGETRYSIGIIPLGGYVRMIGDDPRVLSNIQHQADHPNESKSELDKSDTDSVDEAEEDLPEGTAYKGFDSYLFQDIDDIEDEEIREKLLDKSCWFLSKGYFSKVAIVLAGPGFNFLFAWLLAITTFLMFGIGDAADGPVIGTAIPGNPAYEAGLQKNDRIISIDGRPIAAWTELADVINASGGKQMDFLVEREVSQVKEKLNIEITGRLEDPEVGLLVHGEERSEVYVVGIAPKVEMSAVTFSEALYYASKQVVRVTEISIKSFWYMVMGHISPKNIAGPISIVDIASTHAKNGLEELFPFMILLSVSLAVLNLLPVPILDGGHLVFFTIEALKGSPVSLKVQDAANQVGILVLLALMLFAFGNDIYRVGFE